jgi:hypothetical protein
MTAARIFCPLEQDAVQKGLDTPGSANKPLLLNINIGGVKRIVFKRLRRDKPFDVSTVHSVYS